MDSRSTHPGLTILYLDGSPPLPTLQAATQMTRPARTHGPGLRPTTGRRHLKADGTGDRGRRLRTMKYPGVLHSAPPAQDQTRFTATSQLPEGRIV